MQDLPGEAASFWDLSIPPFGARFADRAHHRVKPRQNPPREGGDAASEVLPAPDAPLPLVLPPPPPAYGGGGAGPMTWRNMMGSVAAPSLPKKKTNKQTN